MSTEADFDAVCSVIGATRATVFEKAVIYMARLHEVEKENRLMRAALDQIAAPDKLVEESGGAFGLQAFRRCQEQARYALGGEPPE